MLFEVFIPSTDPNGFNITARIRAESWIQALQNGLSRLGDTADVKSIMCDFTEAGIDVTEPRSGRVFRIRELEETAPPPTSPAPVPTAPSVPVSAPVSSSAPGTVPRVTEPSPPLRPPAGVPIAVPAPATSLMEPPAATPAPLTAPQASRPSAPSSNTASRAGTTPLARIWSTPTGAHALAGMPPVAERFADSGQEESVVQHPATAGVPMRIGRPTQGGGAVEEMLESLFERSQGVYDQPDLRMAAGYILDLAIQAVPSESGAVFMADINDNDLFFAAARGPKADAVMGFRVPMGKGIVGFCSREGVSLAVSDVQRHPQFYAKISQALGYETKAILCSPAQDGGRVYGALQLINKSNGTSYTDHEVNILNFLAHEFADYLINTGQTGT